MSNQNESIDAKVDRLMHLADIYCGHADLDNRNILQAAISTELSALAVQGELDESKKT